MAQLFKVVFCDKLGRALAIESVYAASNERAVRAAHRTLVRVGGDPANIALHVYARAGSQKRGGWKLQRIDAVGA